MTPTLFASLLMLVSGSVHAVVNAVLKSGSNRLVQITLSSATGAVLLGTGIAFVPLPHGAWTWLAAANLVHLSYFYTLTRSLDGGDLSAAYPIFRGTAPMLTALFATVILQEPLRIWQLTGILLIGGGMLAMVAGRHVPGATLRWSLTTGLLIAAYTVIDAKGVRAAPNAASFIVWFFFAQGVTSLIVLPVFVRVPFWEAARREWKPAVAAGSLSVLTFGLALYALSLGQTAPLAALRETGMVTALLISIFVLKEPVTRARAAAILAICAGAVLIVAQ